MVMLEVQPMFGPKVGKETVRLYKGAIRLSRDLAIASAFMVLADAKTQRIVLLPCAEDARSAQTGASATRVWFSNKSAKAPMLSIAPALQVLGLDPDKAKGIYRARIDKWQEQLGIIVDFSEPLKRSKGGAK